LVTDTPEGTQHTLLGPSLQLFIFYKQIITRQGSTFRVLINWASGPDLKSYCPPKFTGRNFVRKCIFWSKCCFTGCFSKLKITKRRSKKMK